MEQEKKKINILFGLSGSVATIKYLDIIEAFLKNETYDFSIKVIATQNASFFLKEDHRKNQKIIFSDEEIPIYLDKDEWNWKQKGDNILHIDLRNWADVFLIAPLSANTLAKLSHGLCDNLLTSVARAWNFTVKDKEKMLVVNSEQYCQIEKPIVVAPAMNTCMFEHPFTEKQCKKLKKLNIIVLKTVKKVLACGDEGYGAMEEPNKICQTITEILKKI